MNITLFILFIFLLQLVCLYVGGKSSKGMKDRNDYFLAGKTVRFWPLMMTFLATQVGGGVILGSAEEAYKFGWSVLFYPLGAALGLIALGSGIGRRLHQFKVTTVAQIFEVAYRSANLKKTASLLSIISLFMIFIAQIMASHKFMINLGVTNDIWFFAFWAIVIIYTAIGGLKAVIATDIIQAAFFMVVFFISFAVAYFSLENPMQSLVALNPDTGDFLTSSDKWYGWLLMPLLFMVIEQDMGQRCFAADTPRTVSLSTLWAGILTIFVGLIPVFFGVLAKNLGIQALSGSSILMTVIEQTTSPAVTALVGCAVLAAIISTADSLINAISSNLSQDFTLSFLKKESVRSSQLISAVIAVGGVFGSFYFSNVVDMLIQSYELSVSCLFVSIFIALYKTDCNKLSAIISIAFGATGFVLFKFISLGIPKELCTLILSFAGYSIGELIVWVRKTNIQPAKSEVMLK